MNAEWRAVWTDPNTMGDDPPEDQDGPWRKTEARAVQDMNYLPPGAEIESRTAPTPRAKKEN